MKYLRCILVRIYIESVSYNLQSSDEQIKDLNNEKKYCAYDLKNQNSKNINSPQIYIFNAITTACFFFFWTKTSLF